MNNSSLTQLLDDSQKAGHIGAYSNSFYNPFTGFGDFLSGIWGELTGSNSAKRQYEYQKELQEDAQKFNANQALLQRQWSAQSVQNSVKDIKAAGLNPWLAIQGGVPNAASTQSASSGAGAASTGQSQLGMVALGTLGLIGSALKLLAKKGK